MFNLIVEFAIKLAIASKYSDYITVVKPIKFEGYYIEGAVRFN
jgi:hypothetical protein